MIRHRDLNASTVGNVVVGEQPCSLQSFPFMIGMDVLAQALDCIKDPPNAIRCHERCLKFGAVSVDDAQFDPLWRLRNGNVYYRFKGSYGGWTSVESQRGIGYTCYPWVRLGGWVGVDSL